MRKLIFVLAAMGYALPAAAESVHVNLSDYVFDFATYGYEITVDGKTNNFSDKLTADDYITINDNGYKLKTLIDRMGRKDRKEFISFFNDHCIGFSVSCAISTSGDIELDKNMHMIFRMSTVKISKDGNEWSNNPGN